MDVYQDKLYFAGWGKTGDDASLLYCMDAKTGQLLWEDHGPANAVAQGVIIDKQTGYLYALSGWSVFCVDLNKTPR